MAYVTPGTRQNEIVRLQSEITNEVQRDAPSIAQGVFGDNKNHPDMAQVSNQQIDDLYRQKYLANDRQWLQAEARRDPQQFLDVAKRIGVQPPSQTPGAPSPVVQPQTFGQAAMANAAVAPPPVAAAPPAPPPVALAPPPPALPAAPIPAAAAPPVILGPNGLPLNRPIGP